MSRSSIRVIVFGPDDHFRVRDLPEQFEAVLADRHVFPDGEQLVTVPDGTDLSGRDVLVVHSMSGSQDRGLISLLQLLDAVAGVGGAEPTCFVPYLAYQRQDRRMRPGEPHSARMVLALLKAAGVTRLITVDRHSVGPAVPGLVVRDISAGEEFARRPPDWVREVDLVVAPDAGAALRASGVARLLRLPLVVLAKHKDASGTFYARIGNEVRGRHCLVVEDLCSSGSTLVPLRDALFAAGAGMSVFVAHLLAGREVIRVRLARPCGWRPRTASATARPRWRCCSRQSTNGVGARPARAGWVVAGTRNRGRRSAYDRENCG
ncbi:ribose-phosphate pyrophosphokinase [Micromonospora sp. STR1_7]|uniref:ribose-phosphate diphosphokinase n=1 Tax=Micromonospora parastrephiae TaxID=2806101 RepID=A0ABS1XN91_9ACTN|nr:ribose-phosphate diphosphokinase [Micromonospora parastrephiae]MBM0230707.1 ribose-phosphate pyrophosphokinase [Micromonospora parastrephiae]